MGDGGKATISDAARAALLARAQNDAQHHEIADCRRWAGAVLELLGIVDDAKHQIYLLESHCDPAHELRRCRLAEDENTMLRAAIVEERLINAELLEQISMLRDEMERLKPR